MSIADRTVTCPSCGTMLVLSTYNTNVCPECGGLYRKHVEIQALTELLIRSQKEEDQLPPLEFVPKVIDDNGDMP